MAVYGLTLHQESTESRNFRTKMYFSNRHSYSSRYQRTLFIQLIYSVVFDVTMPIAMPTVTVRVTCTSYDVSICKKT